MRLEYFEMIDAIEELDLTAGTIRASATLPVQSPVFEGHFPKFPILPGVLMLEIMNHAAGYLVFRRTNRERFIFLGGVKRAKFRRMVKPGALVDVRSRLTHEGSGFFVAETSLRVDGEVASDAEIILIAQEYPSLEMKSELTKRIDAVRLAESVPA